VLFHVHRWWNCIRPVLSCNFLTAILTASFLNNCDSGQGMLRAVELVSMARVLVEVVNVLVVVVAGHYLILLSKLRC
jgi:hypothetical protein